MAPPSKTTLNENRISDHGEVHFLASSEYGMPPSTTDARVRKPMLGLGASSHAEPAALWFSLAPDR